jgi:pimeloyl-ACP methyl ester carboxylesterase
VDPDVRYARNGTVSLAYEVVGQGEPTLVCLSPFDNLEINWENPLYAHFLHRLASSAQLVLMDRRGSGLSDRFSPDDIPALEVLVDDISVVLDAVGCERAVLFGFEAAAAQCAMFAATRPDRVSGLVLYAATACGSRQPDYPWQWSDEDWDEYLDQVQRQWGTATYASKTLAFFNPSVADDGRIERWWLRWQRLTSSPGSQLAIENQLRRIDVRALLPVISVPTLVMHRTGDPIEPFGQGPYIASQIPGARFVELAGADHQPWAGDSDAIVERIEKFLLELRGYEELAERVLATVLFTDIVASTERAAAMGDSAWRTLIVRHRELARAELDRFRGRFVDSAGDGMLATFDGPARAVRAAEAIVAGSRTLGVEVRAGCHTGEIELLRDGIGGLAVHIGARIAALAGPSEVWASSTVRDLTVGSGLRFEDAGNHHLKGVPETWHLFKVLAVDQTR